MAVTVHGAWQRAELDLEVSTSGVSIKSLVSELRAFFPVRHTVISGEFLQHSPSDGITLRVRADGEIVTKLFDDNFAGCPSLTPESGESVRRLFADAAARVVLTEDPLTLASYYYAILGRYPRETPAHNHYMSNIEQLIPVIKDQERLTLDTQYRTTVLEGLLLLDHRDDFDGAIAKFRDAVAISPDRGLAYVNLGVVYTRTGDSDSAILSLDSAIKAEQSFGASAYTIWGELLFNSGEYQEALTKFVEAMETDPTFARAHAGRGRTHRVRNQLAAAFEHYEEAVKGGLGLVEYGLLHAETGKHQEAIEWYRRATEEDPYDSEAYKYWDKALAEISKYETELSEFVDERHAAELARAKASERAGSCELAEDLYDSAAALADWYNGLVGESTREGPSEHSSDDI